MNVSFNVLNLQCNKSTAKKLTSLQVVVSNYLTLPTTLYFTEGVAVLDLVHCTKHTFSLCWFAILGT